MALTRFWVILVDGTYGYIWSESKPLPGEWITIRVEKPDGSGEIKVFGQVSRIM